MPFKEFELHDSIIKALDEMKYTHATEIQSKVIKPVLAGKNIVGQSQTGTGKTAAFLIPILQKIDTNKKGLQTLILAPTRELAEQIKDEIVELTKYYRVNAVCVYGGASQVVQKKNLARNPGIIVATPGRLLDFINQRVIDIRNVRFLILDEVDRMLDMGFVRDIKKIRNQMKTLEQTLTFSATMNDNMKNIIDEYVADYEFIKIGEEVTVDKINHSQLKVAHPDKIINLIHLIGHHRNEKVVVFTQTKRNTKTITESIQKAGFNVDMLNGDLSQGRRNGTLKRFKENEIKILVTTDVASRGLNMENVGLVVNFDVPKESESYIHRIGRTGRNGASGKAIMLVSDEEHKLVADIEKVHNTKIKISDHDAILDSEGKYYGHKLDKSTDKFGGRQKGGNGAQRGDRGGNRVQMGVREQKPKTRLMKGARPARIQGEEEIKARAEFREEKPGRYDRKRGNKWGKEGERGNKWGKEGERPSKREDRKYFGASKTDDYKKEGGNKRPYRGMGTSYSKKPNTNRRKTD